MNRTKLKLSPAIIDRTVKQNEGNDDEGMEAVLFHSKGRRQRQHRSKKINDNSSSSHSINITEEEEHSVIYESPQNTELLNLVQNKKWEKLLYRLLNKPHIAHVKFTGRSMKSISAGNLVLHEACKYDAPIDVIEALIEANDAAITTKGHSGYLPFHCACANGASIELIRLLCSLHPDSARAVDDDESVLPLHLACKTAVTKEEVYMCLLTSYPEGARIRDDFGRLPIDYAKSIRSDVHRKIAIECLHRANWLESAAKYSRERTESEYHRMIRGYEQVQAQQLKVIQEVHAQEIGELEVVLEIHKEELSERSKDIEELDHHLQEKTDEFHHRVESLEKSMKTKSRKLQGQIEKAKQETTKTQVTLDLKIGESIDLSQKLEQAKNIIESLTQQLEQRTEDIELALEDIETLNRHSEWLESVLGSIRNLSNSESPLMTSTYESAAQSGPDPKIDTCSVSSKPSKLLLRGGSSRVSVGPNTSRKGSIEKREDASIESRIKGSRRE